MRSETSFQIINKFVKNQPNLYKKVQKGRPTLLRFLNVFYFLKECPIFDLQNQKEAKIITAPYDLQIPLP